MLNIISLLFMLIILEIVLRAINSSGRNQDEKLNPIVYNDKTFKIIDQILFIRKWFKWWVWRGK